MSNDSFPVSREVVYIDLDCLLDTRIGVIAQVNPKKAEAILNSETYHNRVRDEFDGISYDDFRKLWSQRNAETLKLSVLTNIIPLLTAIAQAHIQSCHEKNERFEMELVINTYPYELDTETSTEIAAAFQEKLNNIITVRSERISIGFLTPKYCRENFGVMIIYDLEPWVESQMKNFETQQMPKVTVFSPALYCKPPSSEDAAEFDRLKTKPFAVIEYSFAPLFGLRLLDADVFSVYKPKKTA